MYKLGEPKAAVVVKPPVGLAPPPRVMPTGVEGTKLTEILVVPTGTEGTVQEMLVPLTEQFPTANPPPVALTRLGLEPPPVTTLVKVKIGRASCRERV